MMLFKVSENILIDFRAAGCGTPLPKLVRPLCKCNLNTVLQT